MLGVGRLLLITILFFLSSAWAENHQRITNCTPLKIHMRMGTLQTDISPQSEYDSENDPNFNESCFCGLIKKERQIDFITFDFINVFKKTIKFTKVISPTKIDTNKFNIYIQMMGDAQEILAASSELESARKEFIYEKSVVVSRVHNLGNIRKEGNRNFALQSFESNLKNNQQFKFLSKLENQEKLRQEKKDQLKDQLENPSKVKIEDKVMAENKFQDGNQDSKELDSEVEEKFKKLVSAQPKRRSNRYSSSIENIIPGTVPEGDEQEASNQDSNNNEQDNKSGLVNNSGLGNHSSEFFLDSARGGPCSNREAIRLKNPSAAESTGTKYQTTNDSARGSQLMRAEHACNEAKAKFNNKLYFVLAPLGAATSYVKNIANLTNEERAAKGITFESTISFVNQKLKKDLQERIQKKMQTAPKHIFTAEEIKTILSLKIEEIRDIDLIIKSKEENIYIRFNKDFNKRGMDLCDQDV